MKKNDPLNSITIPTVRRIFPELVAKELISVQPMSAPTGFAFRLRAKYDESDASLYEQWKNDDPANNTADFEEFVEKHMPVIREIKEL